MDYRSPAPFGFDRPCFDRGLFGERLARRRYRDGLGSCFPRSRLDGPPPVATSLDRSPIERPPHSPGDRILLAGHACVRLADPAISESLGMRNDVDFYPNGRSSSAAPPPRRGAANILEGEFRTCRAGAMLPRPADREEDRAVTEADLMRLAIARTREGIAAGAKPLRGGHRQGGRGRRLDAQHRLARHRPDGARGGQLPPPGGEGPGDDRPEGLHDVLDLRALPDVPGGDPLGEDRPRRLRGDHRRRRRRRLRRACAWRRATWPRWAGAR